MKGFTQLFHARSGLGAAQHVRERHGRLGDHPLGFILGYQIHLVEHEKRREPAAVGEEGPAIHEPRPERRLIRRGNDDGPLGVRRDHLRLSVFAGGPPEACPSRGDRHDGDGAVAVLRDLDFIAHREHTRAAAGFLLELGVERGGEQRGAVPHERARAEHLSQDHLTVFTRSTGEGQG